ncbi:MAG: hypothetical protein ABIR98_09475 [Usitatibacter sp.]
MTKEESGSWLDANKMASEALALAKKNEAIQRAHLHVTMLLMTTVVKTASREAVEQLLAEFERIRDLSGPAGMAQGDVFAKAIATIERASGPD